MPTSSHHNGVIRIPLKTPICFHASAPRRLCLESVLGGQLKERFGDGPGAAAIVRKYYLDKWTVDERTEIPTASQVIFEGPIRSRTAVPFTRSIFRVVNDPEIRGQIDGVNWDNKISTLERPFKSEAMPPPYEAIGVDAVWYLFRGDIDRIEDAFRRAGRLGSLRAKGGGEIDAQGIRAEQVPNRSRMFGIICGGRLMRPIPASCETALTRLSNSVEYRSGTMETTQPPFYSDAKELCLVPQLTGSEMVLKTSELAGLVT